jgi:hypothetical protein
MEFIDSYGFGIIIAIFLGTLLLGASKKVVIYYNYTDAFISFLSGVLIIVGLVNYAGDQNMAMGAIGIGALLSIKCILDAGKYNKSHAFGWLIGILKVFASLFLAVIFIGALQKMFGKHKRGNIIVNFVIGVIILGLVGWMLRKLVNGPEVYESKGWALPSKSAST